MLTPGKLRHDFINNSLRIEILNQLIIDQIEKNEELDLQYLNDLRKFTGEHASYLEALLCRNTDEYK